MPVAASDGDGEAVRCLSAFHRPGSPSGGLAACQCPCLRLPFRHRVRAAPRASCPPSPAQWAGRTARVATPSRISLQSVEAEQPRRNPAGFLFFGRAVRRPRGQAMTLDFSKLDGLVPAVVQDETSGEVLMVGFMNQEAWDITRRIGYVTFYSRTRNTLWTKGETSGNRLAVTQAPRRLRRRHRAGEGGARGRRQRLPHRRAHLLLQGRRPSGRRRRDELAEAGDPQGLAAGLDGGAVPRAPGSRSASTAAPTSPRSTTPRSAAC